MISGGKGAGNSDSFPESKAMHIGTVDFFDKNAVLNVLREAQQELENLDYEVNISVTPDGKIWRVEGGGSYVNPESIPGDLRGSYSYHNHPPSETHYSFSEQDIAFFISEGEAYSMASDDIYEYVIERTSETVDKDYAEVYTKFKDVYTSDVYEMAYNGDVNIDAYGYHETVNILSKIFSFRYERRKK